MVLMVSRVLAQEAEEGMRREEDRGGGQEAR